MPVEFDICRRRGRNDMQATMRDRKRARLGAVSAALAAMLALAGCGGDDEGQQKPWWLLHAYEDRANGFAMSYPPDWNAEPKSDPDGTVVVFSPADDPDARVFVRAQETEADQLPPVDQFVELFGSDIEGFQKHEAEATTFNLNEAIRLKFSRGSDPEVRTALSFVVLAGGRLYMILAIAPSQSFAKYEEDFDRMGRSFCEMAKEP
jgi:hypothetical protein